MCVLFILSTHWRMWPSLNLKLINEVEANRLEMVVGQASGCVLFICVCTAGTSADPAVPSPPLPDTLPVETQLPTAEEMEVTDDDIIAGRKTPGQTHCLVDCCLQDS